MCVSSVMMLPTMLSSQYTGYPVLVLKQTSRMLSVSVIEVIRNGLM